MYAYKKRPERVASPLVARKSMTPVVAPTAQYDPASLLAWSAKQQEPQKGGTADTTAVDRELLRRYRDETQSPESRSLLDELLPYLDQVSFERDAAGDSGGCTRKAGEEGYSVSYARPAIMSPADQIAVLVHELTHVAVDRAYSSEMLNFPTPALSDTERGAVLSATPGREEDVQNARLGKVDRRQRDRFIDYVVANVGTLLASLSDSGFSAERQKAIRDKLSFHTGQRPFHEYDAVLSHLLIWCDKDGVSRSSDFYRTLTPLIEQAQRWRASGAITLPETATPAGTESSGGRNRGSGLVRRLRRIFRRR